MTVHDRTRSDKGVLHLCNYKRADGSTFVIPCCVNACPVILDAVTKRQVGAWVRQQLDARKLSVKAAVTRSGLSRQTWYDLMADKHPPSVETQRGVAEALGVEPQWYDRLLDGDDPLELPEPPASVVTQPDEILLPSLVELAHQVERIDLDANRQHVATLATNAKIDDLVEVVADLSRRLAVLEARPGRRSSD